MGNSCGGKNGGKDHTGLVVDGNKVPEGTTSNYTFKIVIVGDTGVGKTSLILRFAEGSFPTTTTASVNFDSKEKLLKMGKKVIKIQVWDTAGQERFRTISSTYYRGAQGIILAYDIADERSFTNTTRQWLLEVDRYAPSVAKVLVGMKKDGNRVVSVEDAKEKAQELNIPFMELSAKTGDDEETSKPFLLIAKTLLEELEQ